MRDSFEILSLTFSLAIWERGDLFVQFSYLSRLKLVVGQSLSYIHTHMIYVLDIPFKSENNANGNGSFGWVANSGSGLFF